jgi:hypothetical protein
MAELKDTRVTQDQADRLERPLQLDLEAYFNVLLDDMIAETGENVGSPQAFITEVVGWLESGTS